MKKLSFLLAVIILCVSPVIALADNETPGGDTPGGDAGGSTVLSIDNNNVYEGMDRAYKDGYMPIVSGGVATIILPLVAADGTIPTNTITVTPNLGEPSSSPFVFKNYQKNVGINGNIINGGTITVASYLVRFDLELAAKRVDGVYPVSIDVQAQGTGGPIQQSFTAYVTITDGTDPNAPEPTPKPQSQPKIIVSSYSVNPSPVNAGERFSATVTLKNTSEKKSVQNMTVTVSSDCPNFQLQNDSSTIFVGKLAKDETTDIELDYMTDLETPPQRYNITLAIDYENTDASPLSSSGAIQVSVAQPLNVVLEPPKIPNEVNAGDTMPLSFQVMNLGRSMIYNVRCELAAPGLIPSETAFIGNMEPGTAKQSEMDVFVGMKNMTEGYEGDDKYGYTNGKITLKYEDGNGKEYTAETDIGTMINPPVISPASATPEEKPETASQWWISLIVGGVVIAVLVIVLVARRKKGKQHEDF
jgi:multisubunit Na+/H+ antiporter MnhB subunit